MEYFMRIVYIAHPISHDVENNIKRIEAILNYYMNCQLARERRIWPIAPYLHAFDHLRNETPEDYELGLDSNRHYFERRFINELWVCGDPTLSRGVQKEIGWAHTFGISIIFPDLSRIQTIPPPPPHLKDVSNDQSRNRCATDSGYADRGKRIVA